MAVVLKNKTYNNLMSELMRLEYALENEKKKNETLLSGFKKQLEEKNKFIKQLQETAAKFMEERRNDDN